MSATGYRCVCPLCKTVLVSSLPHGRFQTVEEAARVARAHLLHRCEFVNCSPLTGVELDTYVDASVEAVKGAA